MSMLPVGHTVRVGQHDIHYHEVGPADGFPVVFAHGSGPGASGLSNFQANGEHLAAHGFRAIMPDAIGYGQSDKPTDQAYTLDFFVDHLLGLLDVLQLPTCALVGNSMGGAMTIRATLRAPERVSRLILMAPGGLEEREVYMNMRGIRRMLRCIYGPEGITRDGMRRVFELQLYNPADISDAVIDERTAVALSQPIEVFRTMNIPDQSDRLSEITCPVLGFWGMDDQFCPPSGAPKIAGQCPDARVTLLSRCGHWVMVERPEIFNRALVDFLNER
jgi:4,5:9,10-diseco-3-hydroxy-5,9,17-trioxoandrosta-1(10),2-diene-4-oate hydrolase